MGERATWGFDVVDEGPPLDEPVTWTTITTTAATTATARPTRTRMRLRWRRRSAARFSAALRWVSALRSAFDWLALVIGGSAYRTTPRGRHRAPARSGGATRGHGHAVAGCKTGHPMAGSFLAGVRVLDLSIWRPGPYATSLLCAWERTWSRWSRPEAIRCGATPGSSRRSTPASAAWCSTSRRRRAATGPKRSPPRPTSWWRGSVPGSWPGSGSTSPACDGSTPGSVYCSISGYGQEGDRAQVPGHDVNYQAWSGALAPEGGAGDDAAAPRCRPGRRHERRLRRVRRAGGPERRRSTGRSTRHLHDRRALDLDGTRWPDPCRHARRRPCPATGSSPRRTAARCPSGWSTSSTSGRRCAPCWGARTWPAWSSRRGRRTARRSRPSIAAAVAARRAGELVDDLLAAGRSGRAGARPRRDARGGRVPATFPSGSTRRCGPAGFPLLDEHGARASAPRP